MKLTAIALLGVMVVPVGADASEAPEEISGGSRAEVRAETLPGLSNGHGIWFWPEARRAFRVGGNSLSAFDVDTGEGAGTADLSPPAWNIASNEYVSSQFRRFTGTVDRAGGRVFVAYGTNSRNPTPGDVPCVSPALSGLPECIGGVHVVDGLSMASLGRMRLELPTVEGARVWPILRALEYVPPVPERGWGGRVLMVVEEYANGPTESSVLTSANWQTTNAVARRNGGNVAYAVAFDPETMRQEWAVRLEGCRSAREPRNWGFAEIGDPTAVFRTGGVDPAVYVGCHGSASQLGVVVRVPLDDGGVPATLPLRVGDPVEAADPDAANGGADGARGLVVPAARQEVFAGPEKVQVILADPVSQRILMRVDDSGQVWWVFDGTTNQFIGTIGIGNYYGYSGAQGGGGDTAYGLEEDIGRLYVQAPRTARAPGGLYAADIRRSPLAQALHYPELASTVRGLDRRLQVMPRGETGVTRIYGVFEASIVDESPASVDAAAEDAGVVRTLDVAEAVGVTAATFDGTARGFGFRAILLGGAEGIARVGPADAVGVARGIPEYQGGSDGIADTNDAEPVTGALPRPDPCTDAQRELIVAFVGPRGPAVVDASSARGEAQPVVADARTREDVGGPVTRCGPADWPELWRSALVSQPPMSEPGVDWPFEDATSACTASGDQAEGEAWSDPVVGLFASRVDCSQDQVGGWSQARGVSVDGVSVANTLSSFTIYRDPRRGLVARVESVARGVDVGGVVKINTIRGMAESWANGHTPDLTDPETVDEGVFNPFNCDQSRPAGTCFQRHVFGVAVTSPDGAQGYRCGPCGDEDALVDGINRGLGANGVARFREPDRDLARGSADGYIAAVTKKDAERFSDIVLNADLLETMVPMLEIVRYAPHNRPSSPGQRINDFTLGTPPRARQVYQFAAVEVSSTYGIQCLLVYDEATNTCAAEKRTPGSIAVALADPDGKPLAGGGFEVRADVDSDGVLGLVDTLLPDGACVTAADGIGTCTFDGLAPGGYLISQVAAPAGYAKAAEPFVVELASGEARTVAFTNASNMSVIAVSAADEAGGPVAGAVFAVYPDPDSDGKVAADAVPAATCTTGADGACQMSVPAGSYVLVQTSAPDGLAPIEPVAFTFASGGQTAAVGVVNYPADSDIPQPQPAASPVYTDPVAASSPVETVVDYNPPATEVDAPRVSLPDAVGGTIVRVIRAPGDALRLLSRDPQQAIAFTAALLLFALAVMAVRRRQLLGALAHTPALAFTGGVGPSGGGPVGPSGGPSGGSSGGSSPRSQPPSPSSGGAGTAGSAVAAFHSGASGVGGTAVLERRVVAGAAPAVAENVSARVVVAVAGRELAGIVAQKLAASEHCQVLALVDSFEALRDAVHTSAPDVLVVDLALPTDGDADVCALLAGVHPCDRTVGIVAPGQPANQTIVRAYAAGLGGLLVAADDLGNGQLAYAVRCLADGKRFYGPTVQALLADHLVLATTARPDAPYLTERELEIARLAARGQRRGIARRLFISDNTVRAHLQRVRKKLGMENMRDYRELRRRLEEFGLFDDDGNET